MSGYAGSIGAPALIAITDPVFSDEHLIRQSERMLGAVTRGTVAVQLRDKVRSTLSVFTLAERLAHVCRAHGAPFYVNDRLDVALAVGADGVHLGGGSVDVADARALGPGWFISVAAHSVSDVQRAAREGANAALLSPIFATPGKGTPLGLEALADARGRVREGYLYALGGIDEANGRACFQAGAHGVAAIRAIWTTEDPGALALRMTLGSTS